MKHTLTLITALLLSPLPAIVAAVPSETNSALAAKYVPPHKSPKTGEHPAVSPIENETPAQHDARLAWWREAKFGMFVHWGLYAQAGGAWKGKD